MSARFERDSCYRLCGRSPHSVVVTLRYKQRDKLPRRQAENAVKRAGCVVSMSARRMFSPQQKGWVHV